MPLCFPIFVFVSSQNTHVYITPSIQCLLPVRRVQHKILQSLGKPFHTFYFEGGNFCFLFLRFFLLEIIFVKTLRRNQLDIPQYLLILYLFLKY